MLSVITFKWKAPGYRVEFTAEHVNTLRRMVKRHYPAPHRFFCVTDDPEGLDPHVGYVPLWNDFGDLLSPHGEDYPSCYRRLKMFSPGIADIFGERFVTLDLDCVITGDMRPLWDRSEDIVLWGGTNATTFYNGSMMLMRAGARAQVWTEFDPLRSPAQAQAAGHFGSDQGWISHVLGPRETMWTQSDGVYSWRCDLAQLGYRLPGNAKIVIFHGKKQNPWDQRLRRVQWIRRNWR